MKKLPGTNYLLSMALPAVLFAGYLYDRPFTKVLATSRVSLAELSPQQRINIQNAAARINGVVLDRGAEFSFNRTVGPRTFRRGYLNAPSYVGKEAPFTMGGGICVVSSALYQDALRSGLKITERVPHLRTIGSALPGLDSTVWYGQADLRFADSLDCPVQIITKSTPFDVTVELRGNPHIEGWKPAEITRSVRQVARDQISVQVMSTQFNKTKFISSDVYGITTFGEHHQ
ncbi:MAG TPA: VanW family protein [Planktothrix sp.]|jgi:vancomycin resistance protein YoaR